MGAPSDTAAAEWGARLRVREARPVVTPRTAGEEQARPGEARAPADRLVAPRARQAVKLAEEDRREPPVQAVVRAVEAAARAAVEMPARIT